MSTDQLTRQEMEDIMFEHEKAELEFDVAATMATLVPDPHYELPFLGLAVDGWDAIEETYRRIILPGARDRNVQAVARGYMEGKNTLTREAHVTVDDDDGNRVTGTYMVVMEFDPATKKIKGERMYADTVFGGMMAKLLGDDFATLPGVTRIADTAPIIERHDAFDDAAARGVTINHPLGVQ